MTTAHQLPPDPSRNLTRFPETIVFPGDVMRRAHSASRGAWYFDPSDAGRFNLHDGRGTCYTADNLDTVTREKVRAPAGSAVEPAFADSFVVSKVTSPHEYRCAAVSAPTAVIHGVVRELCTTVDYSVTQQWADALDNTGFDGVHYGSAFTTGPANSYALFGDAGAPDPSEGFTEELYKTGREACLAAGFVIGGMPPSQMFAVNE